MTKISRVLNYLLAEYGYSQTGLAGLCGLGQEKISRLVNSQTRPDRDDITALISAFHEPGDRYRIARAHIADELPEELLKSLEIALTSGSIREQTPPSFTGLPEHVEAALRYLLQEYPDNPSIGDVFADLAAALGWQPRAVAVAVLPKKPPGKTSSYPPHQDTSSTLKDAVDDVRATETAQKPAPPNKPRPVAPTRRRKDSRPSKRTPGQT